MFLTSIDHFRNKVFTLGYFIQNHMNAMDVYDDFLTDLMFCLQLQLQDTKYLQMGSSRGQYYGGSLPNVNQVGSCTADVSFQVRPYQYSFSFQQLGEFGAQINLFSLPVKIKLQTLPHRQ